MRVALQLREPSRAAENPPPLDPYLGQPLEKTQCVPLYTYAADGTRTENVTDWALRQFQDRYAADDPARPLTKPDLFHYAYALLHHPDYRARYAADLKRTLPRLPLAPTAADGGGFWPLADAGRALADLHVHFETAPEYPLTLAHTPGEPLSDRVEKMAWADPDKTALRLNPALTLTGIPPAAHTYRLGNRSALDWLVDQLRVKTDPRSGITHDPNDPADPERVARLVRQVVTVSTETARIVDALPSLGLPDAEDAEVAGTLSAS